MQAQIRGTSIEAPFPARRAGRPSRLVVEGAIKKASLRNIVCSKTLKVKEGCVDPAKKLCLKIADVAHAEMQDRSTGILAFEVFQDPFEERRIHFWERYQDNTRMGRFNTSEPFEKFMKNIQAYLDEPVGLALYDWKNGQLGPLAVQGGPKGRRLFFDADWTIPPLDLGEGGLDDATGAGGRGGASYSQTSDVVNLGDMKRGEEGDKFGMGEKKPLFQLPKFKLPWDKS